MTPDDIIEMCARIVDQNADACEAKGHAQIVLQSNAAAIRALKGTIPGIVREEERAAWQWLDTATFRKHMPKQSNPAEWNPLYRAKKEATK